MGSSGGEGAAFNSETPLVPPRSDGSSGQVPHLGHLIFSVGPGHWADQVHERFVGKQVKGHIEVPVPTGRT